MRHFVKREPKPRKPSRGLFAILVEMLCALFTSLVVKVCHQPADNRGGEPSSPEGRAHTGDGDLSLLSQVSVLQKRKNKNLCDDCDLWYAPGKDGTPWCRKTGKREFADSETGNDMWNWGENAAEDKLLRRIGWLDRLRPGCVSGLVFPVSRQRSERGAHAGEDGEGQSQQTPRADSQWPPASVHGMPWVTFRRELYRLGTFLNLPSDFPVSALRLAQVGFLRLADDVIVCFFCGLVRTQWNRHESPLDIHRQLRPDCPMVTGINCDNVAVTDTQPTEQLVQDMQRWSLDIGASRIPSTIDRKILQNEDTSEDSSSGAPGEETQARSLRNGDSRMPPTTDGNRMQNRNVSEDGFSGAPEARTQARTTSAGAEGHGSANPNIHEQNPQQARRPQQPRLGLLGGAPPSASSSARSPVLDGTAQPEPPAPVPPPPGRPDTRKQVVTYQELGIVTCRPKRPDLATVDSRLATFRSWPGTHRPTPEQLVDAGFFYAGYSDCGRCFTCGVGLRNWEPTDDPWVAHARWFPTCAYVRQCQGQDFIDIVRELTAVNNGGQSVTVSQVREEMARRRVGDPIEDEGRDVAVTSAVGAGYHRREAEAAAQRMLQEGQPLSVVSLMDVLETDGATAAAAATAESEASIPDNSSSHAQIRAEVEALQTENGDLRQRVQCKVCLDKEASVLFLPCGHLGTCGLCSPALHACPLCRLGIKGRVRVFHR